MARTQFLAAVLFSALILLTERPASGIWGEPSLAPVGRIVANLESRLEEYPQDAQVYYLLGRAHSLAFALKSQVLPGLGGDLETVRWRLTVGRKGRPAQPLSEAELAYHVGASVENYQRAIALRDWEAHYHLGLAYILEQGSVLAHRAARVPGAGGEELGAAARGRVSALVERLALPDQRVRRQAAAELRDLLPEAAGLLHRLQPETEPPASWALRDLLAAHWRELATAAYFSAYERARREDVNKERARRERRTFRLPPTGDLRSLTSYEAGQSYLRLVRSRGVRDRLEAQRVQEVELTLKALEEEPRLRMVTPILFALDGPLGLDQLVSAEASVRFDLDGDGLTERWPWVASRTALLVWDPDRTGRVTSGRQLFGSVTWWMFFTNGYEALAVLDDDRDGELAGPELEGLAAWFDRDTDGISDPGEVLPIGELEIEAVAVRPTTEVEGCPAAPLGIRMRDGRWLPTYDWITSPVPETVAEDARRAAGRGR